MAGLYQAHTFEDRVLKIDHVTLARDAVIRPGAVVMLGASVGEGAEVAGNSVVMKRERLLGGRHYAGSRRCGRCTILHGDNGRARRS